MNFWMTGSVIVLIFASVLCWVGARLSDKPGRYILAGSLYAVVGLALLLTGAIFAE